MNLVKLSVLFIGLAFIQGCTVLGLAADIAISAAMDCELDDHRCGTGPSLTVEGAKQDIKVVKKVLDDIQKSREKGNEKISNIQPEKPSPVACKNVVDGKQQCYPAEYYKDMYFK